MRAFQQMMAEAPLLDTQLDHLSLLSPTDREAIRTVSADIRRIIEAVEIPGKLAATITEAVARLGEDTACAVRSSATAEDSPTVSFAGQQDTYLNVVGPTAVLAHISRCWSSLFTERAVTYRLHNGIDNRWASMAVVVQQMVFPQAAGVLPTADPGHVQPEAHRRGGRLRATRSTRWSPVTSSQTSTPCATATSWPNRSPPSGSPSSLPRQEGRKRWRSRRIGSNYRS